MTKDERNRVRNLLPQIQDGAAREAIAVLADLTPDKLAAIEEQEAKDRKAAREKTPAGT